MIKRLQGICGFVEWRKFPPQPPMSETMTEVLDVEKTENVSREVSTDQGVNTGYSTGDEDVNLTNDPVFNELLKKHNNNVRFAGAEYAKLHTNKVRSGPKAHEKAAMLDQVRQDTARLMQAAIEKINLTKGINVGNAGADLAAKWKKK